MELEAEIANSETLLQSFLNRQNLYNIIRTPMRRERYKNGKIRKNT